MVTVSVGPGVAGYSVKVVYSRACPSYVYVSVVVAGHEDEEAAGAAATTAASPAIVKKDLMMIVGNDEMIEV